MKRWIFLLLLLATPTQAVVKNPVAFIGQKVLGSTAGAPLAVDSNNGLVSGLTWTETTQTSNTTTSSTSDVLMNSMTVTPAAGTYFIWFSTTVTCPSLAATVTATLYVGGSAVTHTERHFQVSITGVLGLGGTSDGVLAFQDVAAVNGSQAIEVRWRTSTGTATAFQRSLHILRLL